MSQPRPRDARLPSLKALGATKLCETDAKDGALLTDMLQKLSIDSTGKRKMDGTKAATRLGKGATQSWANERYRQCMLLILEFRTEWQGGSLLTSEDVDRISLQIDCALAVAIQRNHVGDIYDMSPICWAIWLTQQAYARRVGAWTVESEAARYLLSFEGLYRFMERRAARRENKNLYDHTTGKLLKRYSLPFKNMTVPVQKDNLFKFKKGARRLSEWIQSCAGVEMEGLALGIVLQEPPLVVDAPPLEAARNQRAERLWNRAARRSRASNPFRSVQGDGEDEALTRNFVRAVEEAAADSDDEFAAEMEAEMEQSDSVVTNEDSPSGAHGESSTESNENTDGLSEYERERAENIRRNNELLRQLGLLESDDDEPPPKQKAPRPPPKPPGPPSRKSPREQARKEYSEAGGEELTDEQILDDLRRYAKEA